MIASACVSVPFHRFVQQCWTSISLSATMSISIRIAASTFKPLTTERLCCAPAMFAFVTGFWLWCHIAFITSSLPSHTSEPVADHWKIQGRIINGITVELGMYPFMVSLQRLSLEQNVKPQHFCGGTILNDNTILSAGHCMFDDNEVKYTSNNFSVYIGHVDLDPTHFDEKSLFKVKRFTIHAGLDLEKLQLGNDLVVIKLEDRIDFNKFVNVSKICLPTMKIKPIESDCIVIGWGSMTPDNTISASDLHEARVPILPKNKCKLGYYNEEKVICAGQFASERNHSVPDTCQGDSGGPIICPPWKDKRKYLQFGIVSWGDGCGQRPSFYTRVAYYLEWIRKLAED